jgi:hypothetical protein
MKLVHSIALVTAFFALSGFRADDTYTLRQKYKKDEVQIYVANLNITAEDSVVEMEMKTSYKVLGVEEDGAYELEETLLSGTFKFNGEEHAMEKGEPKANKYDKVGTKIKKDGEEEEEDPVSDAIDDVFEYEPKEPVKVGDTWKHEGNYGVMTLTLDGREKVEDVDCLKITLKGTMDKKGATGDVTATFLIRADDFSPVTMDAKIENPKLDSDSPAMKKIEVKMKRAKE